MPENKRVTLKRIIMRSNPDENQSYLIFEDVPAFELKKCYRLENPAYGRKVIDFSEFGKNLSPTYDNVAYGEFFCVCYARKDEDVLPTIQSHLDRYRLAIKRLSDNLARSKEAVEAVQKLVDSATVLRKEA